MAPTKPFSSTKPFKPPRATTASSSTGNPHIESTSSPTNSPQPTATQEGMSQSTGGMSQSTGGIPPALLSRILHDHFQHTDTRITKEAMAVVEKYIDTFTREALVRCVHQKRAESERDGGDADYLEVDDLEKVVAQLLLDF